ncbi:MAG TPA: CopG family transcriptional regulator [Rhodoferax sp.]|nr:CopG family transcriptional regulator [Rhodoferax sp.]
MTVTVKLDDALECALRSRCKALGRSASALVRDALQACLTQTDPAPALFYTLGQDLYGRHAGPVDLASQRKADLSHIWDQKHPARASAESDGSA